LPIAATALLCLVVGVADGDTLTVRCGSTGQFEQVKVRLSGIDAPEKAQPFGQVSKASLSSLCYLNQATITPKATDRYHRVVADVACQGQDAGQHQVSHGMAWVYDRYAKGYSNLYPLQSNARTQRIGLWHDPSPIPPWDWRRPAR